MKIFVDLDDTLFKGDVFPKSIPDYDMIEFVNECYEKGHHIVIWSSRGWSTGIDWTKFTKKQLSKYGVKYHELRFDKPYFDILIDDHTVTPDVAILEGPNKYINED